MLRAPATLALSALLLSAVLVAPAALAAGDSREVRVGREIAQLLDFFVVKPDKRDPLEAVVVDRVAAEIWFLHPMAGDEAGRARCEAYQWLFFGRLSRSKGLRAVFEAFDFLEEVKVVYFDVKTRIEPDGRRGYRQFRKTSPRLEVTVTRETAMNLNYEVLKARMQGPRCVREAERVIDKKWYRGT